MATQVSVPVKIINGMQWADLSSNYPSATHIICGTECRDGGDIPLYSGHRVRTRKFKTNVHWRVATGFELDIRGITQPPNPLAQRAGRRHHKTK